MTDIVNQVCVEQLGDDSLPFAGKNIDIG